MTELAECPFCLAPDSADNATMESKIYRESFRTPIGTTGWRVACRCGAQGRSFDGRRGIMQAEEWWNTRGVSPQLQGRIDTAIAAATQTERAACIAAALDQLESHRPDDYEARGWNNAANHIANVINRRGEQE